MAAFCVPGYDVVELLGFGSGGEVWLAREQSTGAPVALKRLHDDADIAARDRLRREAAVLAGVDHPHVLRLRTVVPAGKSLVLVLDLATGGSLARLLAIRERLTPGEVVTIAVPLAQALATVHAQGLVHGDVTPANVLFTADGRPVLSDLGVARLIGAPQTDVAGTAGYLDPVLGTGAAAGPAADVHGLAATCLTALTGSPPYDEHGARMTPPDESCLLTGVLWRALTAEPSQRLGAADLAAEVFEAATPVPVRLVDVPEGVAAPDAARTAAQLTHRAPRRPMPSERAADVARPTRRRRVGAHRLRVRPVLPVTVGLRAPWRAALVAAVVAGAVTMAAASGLLWGGGPTDQPSEVAVQRPATATSPGGPVGRDPTAVAQAGARDRTWTAVLFALDERRSSAFAAADGGKLREVYAPRSPALRRDLAILDQLARSGLRADGLRLVPFRVEVESRSRSRVLLHVEDTMPVYRLVDRSGATVERRPGRGERSWAVTLQQVGQAWLVYDVERS